MFCSANFISVKAYERKILRTFDFSIIEEKYVKKAILKICISQKIYSVLDLEENVCPLKQTQLYKLY